MAGGGGRVVPGQLLHHAEVVEGPGSEGQVQHRGHVINKTRRQAVGHVTSHPKPPIWHTPPRKTAGTPQADTHRHVNGTAILRLVCQFLSVHQRWASASLPDALYPPSHFEVRQTPFCSIQASRRPPIDVFLVDLPVIDGGGRQLP
jgi:hypothetical protein